MWSKWRLALPFPKKIRSLGSIRCGSVLCPWLRLAKSVSDQRAQVCLSLLLLFHCLFKNSRPIIFARDTARYVCKRICYLLVRNLVTVDELRTISHELTVMNTRVCSHILPLTSISFIESDKQCKLSKHDVTGSSSSRCCYYSTASSTTGVSRLYANSVLLFRRSYMCVEASHFSLSLI